MTYKVIARKYRPQTFREIVGQEHVTRTLANAIQSNRVAHAYIFSGVRGVGKTTTARILAKALNCVKGPTSRARQHVRFMPRDFCRDFARRARNRRSLESRHRPDSRAARDGALRAGVEPLQSGHSRRSASAHRRSFQCAAENSRRAARARHLYSGHNALRRSGRNDQVARAALSISLAQLQGNRGRNRAHRQSRKSENRFGSGGRSRARRGRQPCATGFRFSSRPSRIAATTSPTRRCANCSASWRKACSTNSSRRSKRNPPSARSGLSIG